MSESASEGASQDGEDVNPLKQLLNVDTFEEFIKMGFKSIRDAVGASNKLPDSEKRKNSSTLRNYNELFKEEANKVLEVIQMPLNYSGTQRRIVQYHDNDKSELVIDANDYLLDRASLNMDIQEGIRQAANEPVKFHKFVSGSWNRASVPTEPSGIRIASKEHQELTLNASKVTERPQLKFKDKIDNSNEPWRPNLSEKPNSLKPLTIYPEINEDGEACHPYEYELDMWKPPELQLKWIRPKPPKPLEQTDFVYVNTRELLATMMDELAQHKEIAVDLEHHSYRSFLGFTCLMQISTSSKDYIVDALALREHLGVLNNIFTKPSILKVFHGADHDIQWLQRDFNVYVVNMFDTYQACKTLSFPKLNLAFLLKNYCNVDANKFFQLYDWRTRPLSETALRYAREDTHYLLYIYTVLSNELLKSANGNTNLLESVYQKSTETCKRTYIKPLLDGNSHMLLYRRGRKLFNNKQLFALEKLYQWRDRISREQDESTGYVLPNHMMMQIAENIPREMQGILACCNPIPPVVRQNLAELHQIMMLARDQPLVKAIPEVRNTPVNPSEGYARNKIVELHDMRHWEFRDDLPTILDKNLPPIGEPPQMTSSLIYLEEERRQESSKQLMKKLMDIENAKYLNPYQRYKKVLPYVNQMEQEEREREEREYQEMQQRKKKEREAMLSRSLLNEDVIRFEEKPKLKPVPLSEQVISRKRKSDPNTPRIKDEPEIKKEKTDEDRTKPGKSKVKRERKENNANGDRKPQIKEEAEEGGSLGKFIHVEQSPIINLELNTTESRDSYPREPPSRPQSSNGSFTPYDFKNVDYKKFQSNAEQHLPLKGPKKKNKRKQQFGIKNPPSKKKKGHW